MGTITIRFNDEEEKTIREMAGEQNLPPSTLKHRHGEFGEQPRRLIATRRWSRLLNQGFEHDLLLALLKRAYGEKKPPKFGIRLIGKISNSHQQMRRVGFLRKTRNLTLPKNAAASATYTTKWYISAPFSFVEGIKKAHLFGGLFLAAFSFQRPLYEFLCLLDFRHGPVGTQGENHFFSFFGSFGTTTVGLLFIVVYLLNHLPGKSFLFLGGKPSFFGFDVFTKAPAIHENQTYSVVSFSRNWLSCLALKSLFPVVKRPL